MAIDADTANDRPDKELFADIAECLGVVLMETLRCAILPTKDTGNLREGWRNLANKLYDFYEI